MRPLYRIVGSLAAAGLLGACASTTPATQGKSPVTPQSAAASASAKKKAREGPVVLVVADARRDLPESAHASPDKPVHYVILGGREFTIGGSIAGEPLPQQTEVRREIIKAMRSQGFVETDDRGPAPSIAVVFTWGTASVTENADFESASGLTTPDRRVMRSLVGAGKLNPWEMLPFEMQDVEDAATTDRVYVGLAAYDYAALFKKEKRLLWRVRISIDSLRHTLPESLPVMMASAAPLFSRNSTLPIFMDDRDRRKTGVTVGAPEVIPAEKPPLPTAAPGETPR